MLVCMHQLAKCNKKAPKISTSDGAHALSGALTVSLMFILLSSPGSMVSSHILGARTVSHRAAAFDNTVLEVAEDHLLMRDEGWGSVRIPFYWLRDNCRYLVCEITLNL